MNPLAPIDPPIAMAMLGSCVSQQVISHLHMPGVRRVIGFARMSLAGVTAAPDARRVVDPAILDGRVMEPTVRAWLQADLGKSVPAALAAARPDLLIVDLLEERFDLIAADGGLVFTESWDFVSNRMSDLPGLRQARRIPRLSAEAWDLWHAGLLRFREVTQSVLPPHGRIVLVQAAWASEMITPTGRAALPDMTELMPGRQVSRAAHVDLLGRCVDRFLSVFPEAIYCSATPDSAVADPNHRWGLSPFHYAADYYESVAEQIRQVIRQLAASGTAPGATP